MYKSYLYLLCGELFKIDLLFLVGNIGKLNDSDIFIFLLLYYKSSECNEIIDYILLLNFF
jgi:hypothetical protein